MSTVTFSVSMPSELRDQLDVVAAHARVSRSWLTTTVLTGWLAGVDAAAASGRSRERVINVALAEALEATL